MRHFPDSSKRRQAFTRSFAVARRWLTSSQANAPVADTWDRIGVASALVVFGLMASLLLRLPPIRVEYSALGSPVSVAVTATTLMAGFMALLAAAVTESVLRTHPVFRRLPPLSGMRITWMFWGLPVALVVITTLLLPLAPSRLVQILALFISGLLFTTTLSLLYGTVEKGRPGFRRSRIILNVLAYGSALLLFLLVYQTRTRSLLSGSLVALTAVLLAVELLRSNASHPGQVFMYAAITGLILGQVTWALNYWLLPGLTGGLLLILIFYLVVGVAQQGLQTGLNRRVLLEFAVFTVFSLILIAVVGPGFQG